MQVTPVCRSTDKQLSKSDFKNF
uniref:Uncharacterized protein n=1 Tax=Arundo donax TaxID=35708 RepID=A0A0A9T0N4_ARUDO